jgi:hypothetical protein
MLNLEIFSSELIYHLDCFDKCTRIDKISEAYFAKSFILSLDSNHLGGIDAPKINGVIKIAMLPFLVSIFLVGLCLSWTGKRNCTQTKKVKITWLGKI